MTGERSKTVRRLIELAGETRSARESLATMFGIDFTGIAAEDVVKSAPFDLSPANAIAAAGSFGFAYPGQRDNRTPQMRDRGRLSNFIALSVLAEQTSS